jgi:MFS family permease
MTSLTYVQLLRHNRSFRRLWSGQVVSELGSWFNLIAVLGLVRQVTGGAPEATALMLVLRLIPFALFAPVAGAFADRWSRRTVMIVSDVARGAVALGFLLVRRPEDLWIAYACTIGLALLTAFFEAAKNGALANVTGDEGLLAGNALMFSSRFLLMAAGAALGGAASARFGYESAFIVNALSFIVSAYSIWLIPGEQMVQRAGEPAEGVGPTAVGESDRKRVRVWTDMREGWAYIAQHRLVTVLLCMNFMWAVGGGAIYLLYDRLGSKGFPASTRWQGDAGVAAIYTASGAGLFLGMMLARRIGARVELHGMTAGFMGWTLIAHGVLFALTGLMPTLWLACLTIFVSRAVVAAEFAVQDTMLVRVLPDRLRGRVITTDRAAEIMMTSLTTYLYGWSLHVISPRTLTIISGLLSGAPGLIWLLLVVSGSVRLPRDETKSGQGTEEEKDEALLASAG